MSFSLTPPLPLSPIPNKDQRKKKKEREKSRKIKLNLKVPKKTNHLTFYKINHIRAKLSHKRSGYEPSEERIQGITL